MRIYTKAELSLIKDNYPVSIYKRINRVNSFINKDWNRYIEAIRLANQGQIEWNYSTSLEDLKFFEISQQNILDNI